MKRAEFSYGPLKVLVSFVDVPDGIAKAMVAVTDGQRMYGTGRYIDAQGNLDTASRLLANEVVSDLCKAYEDPEDVLMEARAAARNEEEMEDNLHHASTLIDAAGAFGGGLREAACEIAELEESFVKA